MHTASNSSSFLDGKTIGVVGFGHLGSSIARSLVANGISKDRVKISCRGSDASLARVRESGLDVCLTDTAELMRTSDVILIAARPQDLGSLVGIETKPGAFVISFMAGITLDLLRKVFKGEFCRAMCSGPETIYDGLGVGVTYPNDERGADVLRAAGMTVPRVESEPELDSFTIGICIPPILMNSSFSSEETAAAYDRMAERFPVYGMLREWTGRVIAHEEKTGANKKKSLDGISTKGGTTEAMRNKLKDGGSLIEVIEAGLRRNGELREALAQTITSALQ